MQSKTLVIGLFSFTAIAVALFPAYRDLGATPQVPLNPPPVAPPQVPVPIDRPVVEAVFVLDTTASMGNLIQAAKEKIWSIASTLATARQTPDIRVGLVAYRDRGDAYVTRVVDLSPDLDSMYATLMDFRASGGGDGPESVNQALYDAVHKVSWSTDRQAYKVVFLVGDAPPHMDYQDDVKYPLTIAEAGRKGIVINTVQAGANRATTLQWQQMARLSQGSYLQVGQNGDAVAIATPYDAKLASLSAELDGTRLYYGSAATKAARQRKLDAGEKLHRGASVGSRARRAAFNASEGGAGNFLGEDELVADVSSGRADLADIAAEKLPAAMQTMDMDERRAVIDKTARHRSELKKEVRQLAAQRSDFLKQKVQESGGAKDSLDHKLYDVVREQAAALGLSYDAEAPSY